MFNWIRYRWFRSYRAIEMRIVLLSHRIRANPPNLPAIGEIDYAISRGCNKAKKAALRSALSLGPLGITLAPSMAKCLDSSDYGVRGLAMLALRRLGAASLLVERSIFEFAITYLHEMAANDALLWMLEVPIPVPRLRSFIHHASRYADAYDRSKILEIAEILEATPDPESEDQTREFYRDLLLRFRGYS